MSHFQRTPPDNQILHEHAANTLRYLAHFIEFGLTNIDEYNRNLTVFIKQHRSYGLELDDIIVIFN